MPERLKGLLVYIDNIVIAEIEDRKFAEVTRMLQNSFKKET
jgi:hypothetical protein